jgi:hypothetical protein
MRNEVRDLAREQEDISKKIAGLDDPKRKTLGEAPEKDAALNQLAEQQKRMSELIDKATQLSEQAENSEPLLSRQLYDSVRRIAQDDGKAVKDTRQELLEQGNLTRSFNERLKETEKREGSGKALELTKDLLQQGLLPQAGGDPRRAGGLVAVEAAQAVSRCHQAPCQCRSHQTQPDEADLPWRVQGAPCGCGAGTGIGRLGAPRVRATFGKG